MKKTKYKIEERLDARPASISIKKIEDILKGHGISASTFKRDRNLQLSSDSFIPSDRLDIYALLFDCSADELKNYVVKGKSLRERFAPKLKIKSGLA